MPLMGDVDKTIFDFIKQRQWQKVIDVMKKSPNQAFVTQESYFPKCDNVLPLHEACKHQAPLKVIEVLLQANPDAARIEGQKGYLPLHFACSMDPLLQGKANEEKSSEPDPYSTGLNCVLNQFGWTLDEKENPVSSHLVINKLVTIYPEAARHNNNVDRMLPIHVACKNGAREDIVKTLLTIYPESIHIKDKFGKTPYNWTQLVENPHACDAARLAIKELGPAFCAVSKAAEDRSKAELFKSEKAHKKDIAILKAEHEEKIQKLNEEFKAKVDTIMSDHQASEWKLQKDIERIEKELSDECRKVHAIEQQFLTEKEKTRKLKKALYLDQQDHKETQRMLDVSLKSVERERVDVANEMKLLESELQFEKQRSERMKHELQTVEEALAKQTGKDVLASMMTGLQKGFLQ